MMEKSAAMTIISFSPHPLHTQCSLNEEVKQLRIAKGKKLIKNISTSVLSTH